MVEPLLQKESIHSQIDDLNAITDVDSVWFPNAKWEINLFWDKWVERKKDTPEGKKVFDYTDNSKQKWEIVVGKNADNTYNIRIKKWKFIKKIWKEDWATEKYNESVKATNKKEFNEKLSAMLDKTIWTVKDKKRVDLSKTWKKVYKDLNKNTETQQKNEQKDVSKESKESKTSNESKESKEQQTKKTILKEKPIDLKYNEINKEKKLEPEPNYPDRWTVEGRVIKCLEFASITDAVEDRYGIPRWLLLALMAQESGWDPTMVNLSGDWGAWLIHIQAINAVEYWMKTLPTYTKVGVDAEPRKDMKHWEELVKAKKETGNDLKKLSELDDRFNPVMGIDLAARYFMNFCGWKNCENKWDDRLIAAAKYYNPSKRNWNYIYSVTVYWATINKVRGLPTPKGFSTEIMKVIEWQWAASVNGKQENVNTCTKRTQGAIASLNPSINGKSVSLDEYYSYLRWKWDNYWLAEYKKYDWEHPYVK